MLSLGAEGLLCSSTGQLIRVAAQKVQAVDTTAAGDTLIGYFIAGMTAGKTITSALEWATRAAALTVTQLGAADSIPFATGV